jgi:putative transposase
MTRQHDRTELDRALEIVMEHGTDVLGEAFTMILNQAMKIQRGRVLGAEPYERTEERRGYANGYKPKTVNTAAGRLELSVPKARGVEFYPTALERGVRSDRALVAAIAEMYVKGISTRKVTSVLEELCGLDVSSAQVSRAAATLDVELTAWRERELGKITYVVFDAKYEKVRQAGTVRDAAVLTAIGVTPEGHRTVLGTSAALSEAEVHWREFMQSLVERGMHGVQLIVSDDHAGLRAAREAVFTGIPWQRCQFHLAQNAMHHVPKVAMRKPVAAQLRAIFDAPDRGEAERQLAAMVKEYEPDAPDFAAWLEDNVPESLTVFAIPAAHRRRLRTSNAMERLNKEIARRTRVATLFPNEASLLRLVSAVLSEIDDDWSAGRKYLNMETE